MDIARYIAFLLFFTLTALPAAAPAGEPAPTPPGQEIAWTPLEPGMEAALLGYEKKKGGEFPLRIRIRALRFDPDRYDFRLFSARWEGGPAPTLREWAARKSLVAATNASMYLKDGLTSTGYMRGGEKLNNGRVVARYGSFFVSGPRDPALPRAAVLDRSVDDWQALLPLYDHVVQNFRLMGPGGEQLWPENGPRHAVAAIAEDMNGRILFLFCREPVSVHDFVETLRAHGGLNLNSAMYAEGGSEASLLLNLPGNAVLWNGMTPADYMFSSRGNDIPLPNVLGVVRR